MIFKGAYARTGRDPFGHRIKFPTATDVFVILFMHLSNSFVNILPENILKKGLLQGTGSLMARNHLFSNKSVPIFSFVLLLK